MTALRFQTEGDIRHLQPPFRASYVTQPDTVFVCVMADQPQKVLSEGHICDQIV